MTSGRRAPASPCAVLLSSLLALSCERPPPAAPPPAAAAPRPAAPPPRDRSQLALPDQLLLAGRWSEPTALLRPLSTWANGDLTLELWLRGRVGRPSRPVNLEAPIEFFALWDGKSGPPGLRWAVSFALSADPKAPPPDAPRDVPSPIGLSCAEDAALGPAALRMVCSDSDAVLEQLLPLATRALPLAPLGASDIALELHARPLRGVADATLQARTAGWISAALGLDALNERGQAELAGLSQHLGDELRNLAEDLDGAGLELSLHESRQALELSLVAPRAAVRSELLQLLIGTGAAGIPPNDFWQQQHASEGAGYLWAWSAVPLARLRPSLAALLGALLDFRGLPDRLTQQGRLLIERLPLPAGPIVHASGRLPASSDPRSAPPPWLAELGWEVYGFAGRFSDYEAWADQLAAALNDPILGPQFGRLLRSAWGPRWVPQHVQRRRPLGGRGLPRGTFTLELELTPPREDQAEDARAAGRAPSSSPTWFVVCAPEPDGVRIAWGADEKFLLALLAPSARRAAASTLAARAGLGALHEQRTLVGGFSSLAAFAAASAGALAFGGDSAATVDVAPHRGLSPIPYRLAQRADVPALAFSASLGRDTLEDLLFLMASGLASDGTAASGTAQP